MQAIKCSRNMDIRARPKTDTSEKPRSIRVADPQRVCSIKSAQKNSRLVVRILGVNVPLNSLELSMFLLNHSTSEIKL